MEVEVLRENLKKGLSVIERITRKISNLPVLKNVLIETVENCLKLSTTNLEVSVQCWVLSKIKSHGKVLIPATFLLETLSYLTSDKLTISSKENNLSISTEGHQVQIQGQNPEEFPIIPKIDRTDFFEIPVRGLLEGLSQVVGIPTFSQIRPEISGIYLVVDKEQLKLVTTDSFRLAEKVIEIEERPKKDVSFILPQTTCQELLNIFNEKQGRLKVFFSPNQVLFSWEEQEAAHPRIEVLSRLIEGEYPKYQEIFPKKIKTEGTFDRAEFLNLIKEAGLFSGKISEIKFAFRPKEGKVGIFSQSYDLGKQQSQTRARLEGEEIEISFNYRFLQDGLQNIKSSEILFLVSDENGPGVLKGVGDQSYRYILMPIKSS